MHDCLDYPLTSEYPDMNGGPAIPPYTDFPHEGSSSSNLRQIGDEWVSSSRIESFWSKNKAKLTKLLGEKVTEFADKFWDNNQLKALEILGPNKAELALKFSRPTSLEALKKLGIEYSEIAAHHSFWSKEKLQAIDIIGKENIITHFPYQHFLASDLTVLKALGPDYCTFLKDFKTSEQKQALWLLGPEKAALALNIKDQTEVNALLSNKIEKPEEKSQLCLKFWQETKNTNSLLAGDDNSLWQQLEDHCRIELDPWFEWDFP